MVSIGVTGGIGSGKSSILSFFEQKGIPVYYADQKAKDLVYQPEIKSQIIALMGSDSYTSDGAYHIDFIRQQVFENHDLRIALNQIIHSAVKEDYKQWLKVQNNSYVFKEAAILFESGSYQDNDYNILITAPKELRIERVKKRNQLSKEAILKIMDAQWSDEKKIPLADFVIENIDLDKSITSLKNWLTQHFS